MAQLSRDDRARCRLLRGTSLIGLMFAAAPLLAQETPPDLGPPPPPEQAAPDPAPSPEAAPVAPEADTQAAAEAEPAPADTAPADTAPSAPADTAQAGDETIVVTGSRIRRPNLDSTVPITSIGGEEFFETGRTSVGDTLNQLPALRETFSQANSTQFLGTAGLNLLDLRGLGTQRTLVLVNGRRHVGGDVLNNSVSPDVNTIPTDLIERVDVVTGGNSAIYGSDAIAGVVNFILKRNFEGVEARAQGGLSKYGDAASLYASILAGKNFGDGRGNVAINLEIAKQDPFYASDRPAYRLDNRFVPVDTDPAGTPNGSDGVPDNIFYTDTRSATYTNGGSYREFTNGFTNVYIFQPDGTLVPQVGTRVGRPPNGRFVGGNGNNFRDGTQFGFLPDLTRYSANLVAQYEVSDAFVPFVEAKFSRTSSLSNASGPYFTGAVGETWFTDNPYLTDQALGIIRAADPDADAFGFSINRNVVELGNREERAKRNTWRVVAGVRGDFNDDWNYEFSVNYGVFNEKTRILGNVNLQRMFLAIDAVRDPATGNIVCRSSLDPSTAFAFDPTNDLSNSTLANDISSCVPINLFGEGNISEAARQYVLADSRARGKITQLVVGGFVSGDSSQLFELPGGPIGFAIGAEHRRETNYYRQDDITASGITFYNAIPLFDPPAFGVSELFGELRVPIIKDTPFLQELTVTAAGRLAKYKGNDKLVKAYNAGVDWVPIRDLHLRGNYSRAVRAPNLAELYTPLGQNYTPAPDDPCSERNLGIGSATREANCRADGVPAGYDFVYTASLPFQSGGNPDLQPEKSNSWTFGGVFTPSFLPGFSLSADYYNIEVKNVIASLTAQQILDQCYDSSTIDNQYCALFDRAGAGGGAGGEIFGQILDNSLRVVPLNYAKLKVRGIDFDVNYRHDLGDIGKLTLRGVYTRVFQNDQYLDVTDPNIADQVLYELGDPRDAFNISASLKHGPITFGYKFRYIGKMTIDAYENYFSKQGRDPENADFTAEIWYPKVTYHDIRLDADLVQGFNLYAGIDNVTNKKPPFGLTGTGAGEAIYNNVGRFFYAGFVKKF